MSALLTRQRAFIVTVTILMTSLLLSTVSVRPGFAQASLEETSLEFVPADASFYLSLQRNREQYQRLAGTKAFAKLRAMPFVQQAMQKVKEEWNGNEDLRDVRHFFGQDVNQELLSLLCDAVSDEVFIYGDSSFARWVSAMNQLSNATTIAQLKALQTGEDPEELVRAEMIKIINENPDLLQSPTTVIGFRLRDEAVATRQLARLERAVGELLDNHAPELRGRMTREGIGQSSFLTFRVDGSLVPWADVLAGAEVDEDDAEVLLDKLNQVQISLSLGVWRGYLLLSMSRDNEPLRSLGTGELLAARRELAPLARTKDKRITGIAFVDGDFLRQVSAVDQQINQLTGLVKAVLPIAPIAPEIKDELSNDAEQFGQELKAMVPEMGSISSYAFLTDTGSESFTFNWGQQPTIDGSKPLTILNHLGGSPIAFAAGRSKKYPEADEFGRKWGVKLVHYAERIAVPFLDAEQRETYEKVKQEMLPLLTRLDKANREKLEVALADGQSAIVLDARLKSAKWMATLPAANTELPLPEICCVCGVTDAGLLKEGFAEYFRVAQTALIKLNEIAPDKIPPIKLSRPQTETTETGTVYFYATPPQAGLDPRIAANAGVTDQVLVVSLVPEATQRLMTEQPVKVENTLVSTDRPLASAWQFNMSAFVAMVRPWVNYGFDTAADEGAVDEEIRSQVNTVLDVLSCLRTASGISYMEGDVLISHHATVVKDIE